ncbi:hypothetical protein ACLB2K_052231 [Fragaria x ananassa]
MVTGGRSSGEMTVGLLGAVSSCSAASRTQSPAQGEREGDGGPNGTGPAVSGGQTAAGDGGKSRRRESSGKKERRESSGKKERRERKERRRKKWARAWVISPTRST